MRKELEHFYIGNSYGGHQWLDFRILWDTGYDSKGGLVLYDIK